MDLSKALAKILEGSGASRIHAVADILKNGGVTTADDLKYFYWTSLKDLGGLSTMEVNKIMRYIQKKFPEEYEEYKRKRTEERKLQNEVEILNFKAEHEKKLQQVKIKFEEETAARMKEQQEKEEEFRRSLQNQQNLSKKTNTFLQGSFTNMMTKACANVKEIFNSKWESKEGNVVTIEEVISEILKGCDETRIAEVVSLLTEIGATTADDLKKYNQEILDSIDRLTDDEKNKIMMFIGRNCHEKHEQTKNEAKTHEALSKNKVGVSKQDKIRSVTDERMMFEEVIYKIFAGCSNEARINKIKEILLEDDITRADELSCFDWKLLENLGLTSSEATRIMDFVKEKFPKHYKKHEIKRDEVNRMQEELLKQAEINELLNSEVKPSREKKTEDVGLQGKQSTSRAEETELRQKIDEATSNKIEDLTQTTNSSQLQEESQKSSSNSIESHSSKPLENVDSLKIELKSSLKNDDVILLEKFKKFDWDSLDNIELLKFLELFKKQMLKSGMEIENFQTQEEYSNHKAGNLPNDKFKDFNSNTSNGQPQKAEDNQSLEKQPSPHCEVIETEEIGNSSSNTDKRKDESQVKDVANLNYGRFTEV